MFQIITKQNITGCPRIKMLTAAIIAVIKAFKLITIWCSKINSGFSGSPITYGAFDEINTSHVVSATSLKNSHANMNMAIHTGDDINTAVQNRKLFFQLFNINYAHLITVRQTHSDIFYTAETKPETIIKDINQLPEADAIITTQKKLPIALFTADCMPLFIYSTANPLIALIHAGWKGSKKGIIRKTLSHIINYYNISPKDLIVGPGPTIGDCCYSVSEDFYDFFNEKYLIFKNKTLYFNLYESNIDQVREVGVPERNILHNSFCTLCHKDLCHSYRKDKTIFRMTSFMMLK